MQSYSIDEVVKKSGSVSDFISRLLADLQAEHGVVVKIRGGLNSDVHEFRDGTIIKITAAYGRIYVEQVQ